MKEIQTPESYNYIGIFLTYKCSLGCDYCINRFNSNPKATELTGEEWSLGLARLQCRPDLPLSIQGGEPTEHKDFYHIVDRMRNLNKPMDLLTNGMFNYNEFTTKVSRFAFDRVAPYAPIRVSVHTKTDISLTTKMFLLQSRGYKVGLWGIKHPDPYTQRHNEAFKDVCMWLGLEYREKEFLGIFNGALYGTYKYPYAMNNKPHEALCKPSEMLIAPDGYIYSCHYKLYNAVEPVGHILDKKVELPDEHMKCNTCGLCNPCDIKLKTNRFQEYGHCSVDIKEDSCSKEGEKLLGETLDGTC